MDTRSPMRTSGHWLEEIGKLLPELNQTGVSTA
jgi:hypothetical protein